MVWIRKARAGSDSHGHRWEEDGAVVDVAPEHVHDLLGIPDGGFSEAPEPEPVGVEPYPPHDPPQDRLVDLEALRVAVEESKAAEWELEGTEPEPEPEPETTVDPEPEQPKVGPGSKGGRVRRSRTSGE